VDVFGVLGKWGCALVITRGLGSISVGYATAENVRHAERNPRDKAMSLNCLTRLTSTRRGGAIACMTAMTAGQSLASI
jgi:hypothetical protein